MPQNIAFACKNVSERQTLSVVVRKVVSRPVDVTGRYYSGYVLIIRVAVHWTRQTRVVAWGAIYLWGAHVRYHES